MSTTKAGRTRQQRPSARARRLAFHASGLDERLEDIGSVRFTLVLSDGAEEQLRGESIETTARGDLLVWGRSLQPDGPPIPIVIMALAAGEWRACYAMITPLMGGGGAAVMGVRSSAR